MPETTSCRESLLIEALGSLLLRADGLVASLQTGKPEPIEWARYFAAKHYAETVLSISSQPKETPCTTTPPK